MAQRSFSQQVQALRLGAEEEFRGEGILAVAKVLPQSAAAYVGGYQGAPISHLRDAFADSQEILDELGVRVEASASAAAAMLAASIDYPLRGAVTWKSMVGTNVTSDALANLASAGVRGAALVILGEDYGEDVSIMQERTHAFALKSRMWLLDPKPSLSALVRAVDQILRAEAQSASATGSHELAEAAARGLAPWMTFEDPIRVADLKTRHARFERIRSGARAEPQQIISITDFIMKSRLEEIVGTLPAHLRRSARARQWLSFLTSGWKVRTSTVAGFVLRRCIASLRRFRRATLRFHEENERIERWVCTRESLAPRNHALAVEVARAQRLVKGYGDTHERGWRAFLALMAQLNKLKKRADGAAILAQLQDAALADEDGRTLPAELARL